MFLPMFIAGCWNQETQEMLKGMFIKKFIDMFFNVHCSVWGAGNVPGGDVYGNVFLWKCLGILIAMVKEPSWAGNIYKKVFGNIYDTICGNINGNIFGNVCGNVYGNVYGCW